MNCLKTNSRCVAWQALVVLLVAATGVQAQSSTDAPSLAPDDSSPRPPGVVEIDPVASDDRIATRIEKILRTTEWFVDPSVRVDDGVAFLQGTTDREDRKAWAADMAAGTEGVVTVVNRIEARRTSMWNLSPAWSRVKGLAAAMVRNIPLILVGLGLLVLTWFVTGLTVRATTALLTGRIKSELLLVVLARSLAIPVFLLGLYLVLRVSGLTRLAVTVLGGTGLMGLVLGFAFRDIAENFLASILISMHHPFARGDLVEINGFKGYVQSVNARSTLLMTLEGNHVQITNATIYKSTITNFSANPNMRFDFLVGIGYGDSIAEAQNVAIGILRDHPAIIDDPDPFVVVESLGASTVNLRAYFWVDGQTLSGIKVRSAVIRLTKSAFDAAGISMPDEAREVVFPDGVPVIMRPDEKALPVTDQHPAQAAEPLPSGSDATTAEGDLSSDAADIEKQAQKSRKPEGGDLLGN